MVVFILFKFFGGNNFLYVTPFQTILCSHFRGYHHFRLLAKVGFKSLKWVRLWPIFAPLHENRRWMSFTVGEPREEQHLSGSVLSKESLKQGIQWPKTFATQRTVLLLWHRGDAVSKVPLIANTRALDSLCLLQSQSHCAAFFFLFLKLYYYFA